MQVTHVKSLTQGQTTDTTLVGPNEWNSNHGLVINISGNTLGSANVSGQAMTLVGGNNLTLSADTAASKLAFLVGPAVSQMEPFPLGNNTSASSLLAGSVFFQHFEVPPGGMIFNRINKLMSLSLNASFSASSNHTGSQSNSWQYVESYGIYSRQAGTNSTLLGLMSSSSFSFGLSNSIQIASAAGTNVSLSQTMNMGFIGTINSAGAITTNTFSSNASVSTVSSSTAQANILSNVTGLNQVEMPWSNSSSLAGGDYWLGMIGTTNVTTAGTATTLGSVSHLIMTAITTGLKLMGQTVSNSSVRLVEALGYYASAALPANVTMSSISNPANITVYFNMVNLALQGT